MNCTITSGSVDLGPAGIEWVGTGNCSLDSGMAFATTDGPFWLGAGSTTTSFNDWLFLRSFTMGGTSLSWMPVQGATTLEATASISTAVGPITHQGIYPGTFTVDEQIVDGSQTFDISGTAQGQFNILQVKGYCPGCFYLDSATLKFNVPEPTALPLLCTALILLWGLRKLRWGNPYRSS